jgi:RNA polymerase sigma-70 factor (ECF subfamily)
MTNKADPSERLMRETAVMNRFLGTPDEQSFADLFRTFTPQLVAFFRARGCTLMAEDLAQEVMFTVYRKAGQVRDWSLFRAWIFRIARNTLSRHYVRGARDVDMVSLADLPEGLVAINPRNGAAPMFEFSHWMNFLGPHEREAVTLRFIEEWEYHEIAAAQQIPIGTVQWRVFNAKRKLAPLLKRVERAGKTAARSFRKAA